MASKIINIDLEYTPEDLKHRFTKTVAHYTVWWDGGWESVSAEHESEAVHAMLALVAEAENEKTGKDANRFPIKYYDVEIGRITYIGFTDEQVAERVGKQHDEALRHDNHLARDAKAKVEEAAQEIASAKARRRRFRCAAISRAMSDAISAADNKSKELRISLGLSEYSNKVRVTTAGNVIVEITVALDRMPDLIHALGTQGFKIS